MARCVEKNVVINRMVRATERKFYYYNDTALLSYVCDWKSRLWSNELADCKVICSIVFTLHALGYFEFHLVCSLTWLTAITVQHVKIALLLLLLYSKQKSGLATTLTTHFLGFPHAML